MPTDPKPSAIDRIRSAGVIVGPLAFISSWAVSGAVTNGYSPIRDHISDLAAVDAPTRPLMNAAFGTFGVAVAVAASPLHRLIGTPGVVLVGANTLASFGIALAPLGRSTAGDRVHGVVAGLGYLALAATAPSAAPALAKRSRPLAVASVGVGVATFASMVVSLVGPASTAGFWQRAGITITDAWLITIGLLGVSGYGTRTEPVSPPTP